MERYQVILAYDGTHFLGFQRQARTQTVQGVIEEALRKLGWSGKAILAAGRTDTGVHATGQVIAFDLEWSHSPQELCQALNAHLPDDVAVQSAYVADPRFHPRYDATQRSYRYRIYSQMSRQPLLDRFAWRVWPPVEAELLRQAAASLIGAHDFAAFGTPPRAGGSTIRKVYQAEWYEDGLELVFEICADAFLYHMTRKLVSFQVEIGQGKHSLVDLQNCLAEPAQFPVQGLAPAHGLTLVGVSYSN
jgi:tRNA pseudouridine38-40 synthase